MNMNFSNRFTERRECEMKEKRKMNEIRND